MAFDFAIDKVKQIEKNVVDVETESEFNGAIQITNSLVHFTNDKVDEMYQKRNELLSEFPECLSMIEEYSAFDF